LSYTHTLRAPIGSISDTDYRHCFFSALCDVRAGSWQNG